VGNRVGKIGSVKNVGSNPTAQWPEVGAGVPSGRTRSEKFVALACHLVAFRKRKLPAARHRPKIDWVPYPGQ
jgi:hypothetical protein